MFERNDRSISRFRGLPLLVLLGAVLVIAGSAAWWLRSSRQQQAAPSPYANATAPAAVQTNGQLAITLYVPGSGGLETLQTSIPKQHQAQLEARAAIAAVLAVDRGAPSLLRGFSLRGCYLDDGGTAYVDVALPGKQEVRASARDELLAVYAIVNTAIMNFSEVRQVRFLIDGKEAQTLAGHIDLLRAFGKRADLVRP